MSKRLSTTHFYFFILSSTLLISGSAYALYFGVKYYEERNSLNPRYNVQALIQTGPRKEALKSVYLAELLELSIDQQVSLYRFDLQEAKKKLLASPFIAEVELKKVFPHTLYIEYTVHDPIAQLGEFENLGISSEGYIFPLSPFYSPKHLPEIFLGLTKEEIVFGTPIQKEEFQLYKKISNLLSQLALEDRFLLKAYDLSKACADRYARQEIILRLEDELVLPNQKEEVVCLFPKLLRLSPRNYPKQIGNFLELRRQMLHDYSEQLIKRSFGDVHRVLFQEKVVDLRLQDLAFIDEGK